MNKKIILFFQGPLSFDGAMRALLCMLPMAISPLLGLATFMVPLGQAGFFYSTLPLPKYRLGRILVSMLILSVGLSFYLLGGNVAGNLWLMTLYALLVGIALVLLTSWYMLSILAFSFMSIFSAGLNAGSPEKAASSFIAFSIAIAWGSLISLLPQFKGSDIPEFKLIPPSKLLDSALRMGAGVAIASFIADAFTFSKLGWAPSAVGSVIRFDGEGAKKRAWLRVIATIIGASITALIFFLTTNTTILLFCAVGLTVLNGLMKNKMIGKIPLLYTATILLLYSFNNPSGSGLLELQRIAFNIVGVLIAIFVVWYPFPVVSKKIARSLSEMKLS